MTDLSKKELERYHRHLLLPNFGPEGQKKLKEARVLVIGCGGLGAPLLQYLAAAGVGTIGIVDFDTVDESNLQRQVLFSVYDIGRSKIEVAAEELEAANPYIRIITHHTRFTPDNALDLIKDYDIVADGTDNFPTRYLVNDACVIGGKVNVFASIFRFDGQVSVFNYLKKDGTRGPHYRDLFPEPPPAGSVPSCAEGGVLGVLPGIIGCIQANEVIKVATGIGEPLVGRLFLFDALHLTSQEIEFDSDPNTPHIEKLIDYEVFCGTKNKAVSAIREITPAEFFEMQSGGEPFQLIDVREPHEYEESNLGGILIPLSTISVHSEKIAREIPVVIHCRSGARSAKAIEILNKEFGFDNLLNLKGGILACV